MPDNQPISIELFLRTTQSLAEDLKKAMVAVEVRTDETMALMREDIRQLTAAVHKRLETLERLVYVDEDSNPPLRTVVAAHTQALSRLVGIPDRVEAIEQIEESRKWWTGKAATVGASFIAAILGSAGTAVAARLFGGP